MEVTYPKKFSVLWVTYLMLFTQIVQVTRPDGKPETLGLVVLDEPMANQSDPTGIIN